MKKIIGEIRKTKIKNVKKIKDFEKFLLREKKNVYIYIYFKLEQCETCWVSPKAD